MKNFNCLLLLLSFLIIILFQTLASTSLSTLLPKPTTTSTSRASIDTSTGTAEIDNIDIDLYGGALVPKRPIFSFPPDYFVYGQIFQSNPLGITYLRHAVNTDRAVAASYGLSSDLATIGTACIAKELQSKLRENNPIFSNISLYTQIFEALDNVQMKSGWAASAFDQAGVAAVVGPGTHQNTAILTSFFASLPASFLDGSCTLQQLDDPANYGPILRTVPSDSSAAMALGDLMVNLNWSLTTLVIVDSFYGSSGAVSLIAAAIEYNISSTCFWSTDLYDPKFGQEANIECLRNSDSNVVVIWDELSRVPDIIEGYRQAGLSDLVFIFSQEVGGRNGFALYIADQIATMPENIDNYNQTYFDVLAYLEGSMTIIPYPGDMTHYDSCLESKINALTGTPEEVELYQKEFRCYIKKYMPENLLEQVPLCIDRVDQRFNPCLCNGEEKPSDIMSYSRVNYLYAAYEAVANAFKVMNENCTLIGEIIERDFCANNNWVATELDQIMRALEFDSYVGHVAFHNNLPKNWTYWILQLNSTGAANLIATRHDNEGIVINYDQLIWKNGNKPLSEYLPILPGTAASIVLISIFGLVILWDLLLHIAFFIHRKRRVIKKTSPIFTQLLILGSDLICASQILWNIPQQSDFTCFAKVWCLALGYGLLTSCIIAKLYRIYVIFFTKAAISTVTGRSEGSSWAIQDRYLILIPTAVLLFESLLVMLYMVISGPPVPTTFTSSGGELVQNCQVPDEGVQLGFQIALLAFNELLTLVSVALAYMTRNVQAAFNDNESLTYASYICIIIPILVLCLYYTNDNVSGLPDRQMWLRSMGILICLLVTVLLHTVPKLLVIRKERIHRRKEQRREQRQHEERVRLLQDIPMGHRVHSLDDSAVSSDESSVLSAQRLLLDEDDNIFVTASRQ